MGTPSRRSAWDRKNPASNPSLNETQLESPHGQESNGELRELLCGLLDRTNLGRDEIESELDVLERLHNDVVYGELIFVLSQLRFSPEDARRHWERIADHRRAIQQTLGSWVDIRVALVDYFIKVCPRLRNPRIIEASLFERLRESVYRDELTSLPNYRFFSEQLERETARSRRACAPLSLLMIDADNFKAYNDDHGHDAGNLALIAVGRLITDSVRREDIAARFGGEEFAVLLPGTGKPDAMAVAERVRAEVETYGAFEPQNEMTVSIGVATFPADASDAAELTRAADRALYDAKRAGKNRALPFGASTRSHRRLDMSIAGTFRVLDREHHDLTTMKVGEGGFLMRADHDVSIGTLVEIDLELTDSKRRVRIPGRVVGVQRTEDGAYEAAIDTFDLAAADRAALAQHLSQ